MTQISNSEDVVRAIFSPQLNVGQIHNIELTVNGHEIVFTVLDCSEGSTASHAGVFAEIEGHTLTGGPNPVLASLAPNMPESFVMMAIQEELLNIAKNNFVQF